MIELKRITKAVWVEYSEDKEVSFLIRPFLLSEFGSIRSTVRKKVAVKVPKGIEVVDDVDEFELSRLVFMSSLEDWKGLTVADEEGKELDKEEQKMVIFNHSVLREFIVEAASNLGESVSFTRENERKNS